MGLSGANCIAPPAKLGPQGNMSTSQSFGSAQFVYTSEQLLKEAPTPTSPATKSHRLPRFLGGRPAQPTYGPLSITPAPPPWRLNSPPWCERFAQSIKQMPTPTTVCS